MKLRHIPLAATFVLAMHTLLLAQTLGTFNGRVTDETDAALPGTTVTARHLATGVERRSVTNAEGFYSLAALDPGTYEVGAELSGFVRAVRRDVPLPVGATIALDFRMVLTGLAETLTVTGAAPLIERTSSVVRGVVRQEQIASLPLLGRDFTSLTVLIPGARTANSKVPTQSQQGSLSFGGVGRGKFNLLVDGGENKDDGVSVVLINYALDSIEEFNVETHRFSAEAGRTSGAAISILTKSGTNEVRGSSFLFARDSILTAKDFFAERDNQPKPTFDRQQFGAAAGGPLRRNRAFWFGAVEQTLDDKKLTVPQGVIDQLRFLEPFGVTPTQSWPITLGDTKYMAKVNVQMGQNHSGFVRVGGQHTSSDNNQGARSSIINRDFTATTDVTDAVSVLANDNWIVSPSVVNQLTVHYSTWRNELDWTDGAPPPLQRNLIFPSVQTGAAGQALYQLNHQRKVQVRNAVTAQRGAHTLRFGGDYWRNLVGPGGLFENNAAGYLTFFDDPSTIVRNANGRYPQGFQTPGIVQLFFQASSGQDFEAKPGSVQSFASWLQDDWRVSRNLTLNLGLRYDLSPGFFGQAEAELSRTFRVLRAIESPWARGTPKTDWSNASPRLGVAYDFGGQGRTVLRGGYGLYYDVPEVTVQWAHFANMKPYPIINKQLVNTTIGVGELATYRFGVDPPPSGPGRPTELLPGGRATGYWYDPDVANPYNHQFHVGLSRTLTPTTVVTADYIRALDRDRTFSQEINPIENGVRRLAPVLRAVLGDPNLLGPISLFRTGLDGRYDELALKVERRAARAALQASYTFSRSMTYAGATSVSADEPFGPGEWGPSEVDERHRVVVAGAFEAPLGIKVAPVFQVASARPYNLLAGVDRNGDGRLTDRYIDPATGAMVAWNAARGRPVVLLDLRVTRNVVGGDRKRLEVFAEIFNLFNRGNFGALYVGNARSGLFQQPVGLLPDIGYPRQLQLGARFTF